MARMTQDLTGTDGPRKEQDPNAAHVGWAALPGMLLEAVVSPAVNIAGITTQAVGSLVGADGVAGVGSDILVGNQQVANAAKRNPAASAQVVAGAAATVAGVVTGGTVSAAGVGLLAKGIGGLTVDTIEAHAEKEARVAATTAGTSPTGEGGSGAPAPITSTGPSPDLSESPTWWDRFVGWVRVQLEELS